MRRVLDLNPTPPVQTETQQQREVNLRPGELLPVDDDGVGGRLVAVPAALLVTTPTGRQKNTFHTLSATCRPGASKLTLALDEAWWFSNCGPWPPGRAESR